MLFLEVLKARGELQEDAHMCVGGCDGEVCRRHIQPAAPLALSQIGRLAPKAN